MWIEMKPLDTLFFRDGKPFSMGEEVWADTVFPPYPSTIYGALRTLYFAHHPEDIDKAETEKDPTKNLVIRNILIKQNGIYYLPIPSDLVTPKDKEELKMLKLSEKSKEYFSNYPLDYILLPENNEKVEAITGFISIHDFAKYVQGEAPKDYKKLQDIRVEEPKIGIGLDREMRAAREHNIYRVGMLRTKGELRIVVEFEGLDLPDKGFMKLGGEGKIINYEKVTDVPEIPFPQVSGDIFKVFLATPTYFVNGWLPGGMKENIWKYYDMELELIAASFKGYLSIGGFNMKKKRPKKMRRFLPAGSVLYFKLLKGDLNKLKEAFRNRPISEDETLKKQGFGISYICKKYRIRRL